MPDPASTSNKDDSRLPNGRIKMADHYGRRKLPIMVRQGKKSQKPSWPFMELFGLYRRAIEADGNCLFRALSDQLYNTTKRHDEIRDNIVEYLRTNRDHFYPFVLANVEEDFIRSQPTTRSSRSRKSGVERDPFDIYLENMAKPNTWGGDIEITAFCAVYDRDVLIHRPTDAQTPFTQVVNSKRPAGQAKEYVHISFGDEEAFAHYESVRRRKGASPPPPPLPSPLITHSTSAIQGALCGPAEQHLALAEYSHDSFNKLHEARPTLTHEELHAFLEKSRRQLDETFSNMINTDRERSSSVSSASQRSSSSKRSREDDAEDSDRTSKRTLRRISLRNKTRAFVSFTSPPSSSNGTEISFSIRVDSPPNTPIKSPHCQGGGAEEEKDQEGNTNQERKEAAGEVEELDSSPQSLREQGDTVPSANAPGTRGRTKSRAKNA